MQTDMNPFESRVVILENQPADGVELASRLWELRVSFVRQWIDGRHGFVEALSDSQAEVILADCVLSRSRLVRWIRKVPRARIAVVTGVCADELAYRLRLAAAQRYRSISEGGVVGQAVQRALAILKAHRQGPSRWPSALPWSNQTKGAR